MGSFTGLKSIRDFTDNHDDKSSKLDWDALLKSNGYYCVSIPSSKLKHVYTWLKENIDNKDYVWVGVNFYFTYEKDAVIFALRWS